jgi:hypothetical protein
MEEFERENDLSKFVPPAPVLTGTYFAYYDKISKVLLSVTNEPNSQFTDFVEVDFETYERLVSGRERFSDYLLGLVKEEEKTTLKLMPKLEHAYYFKNTMLELVSDVPTKNTDLVVEWNSVKKEWNFFLTPDAKVRLGHRASESKLLFFIILESDYDFLIRTIVIDSEQIIKNYCVGFPFESEIESQIDKISVATKLVLESYGLRKVNE